MKYVIFHNLADDSYMNTVENFRGAYASTQTVDIYFKAAASGTGQGIASYDKIICVVTDGEEDRAVEQLAGVMSGSGPKGRITVVADDVNSVYACQDITAVTSISMAATGTFKTVESITPPGDGTGADSETNTKDLEITDSGKTFIVEMGTNTAAFRLPAVSGAAGTHYTFIMSFTSDGEASKDFILSTDADAENIMGVGIDAGAVHDSISTTSVLTLDSSAGNVGAGDRVSCVCDGTHWYITDCSALSAGAWVVADNAI